MDSLKPRRKFLQDAALGVAGWAAAGMASPHRFWARQAKDAKEAVGAAALPVKYQVLRHRQARPEGRAG